MKKEQAQLNFIEDILNLIDIAWSANQKSNKLILNFSPFLSVKEQIELLKDLKKKQAIGNFKQFADYFLISSPSHNLLLGEYNRLSPKQEIPALPGQPISLKGQSISYDSKKSAVLIGEYKVFLPIDQNEDNLCQVMFKHQVEEKVDWVDVFTRIKGLEPSFESKKIMTKNKTCIRDTVLRLNKRIKQALNTQDDLLGWDNKHVRRLY